jgi:predicted glycogen debranching enzyme
MRIAFGRQVCGSLDEASSREWLVTDGLGGYACGTVSGLRTRRYHGLLVVPTVTAGAARMSGLAALDAVVVVGDRRHRLATHEWAGGALDPQGHHLLSSFDLDDGVPRWRYDLGEVQVEVEVAMVHGRSEVAVVHRLLAGRARLELTPLCTWRDQHGDRFAGPPPQVDHDPDGFVFEDAYRVDGPGWAAGGEWYRGCRHREEAARGLGDVEDVWAAGSFVADLEAGDVLQVSAVALPGLGVPSAPDAPPPGEARAVVAAARDRAGTLARRAGVDDGVDRLLVSAADRFVVAAPGGSTAVAGYPWFGEWSRDLFTSYEGLFLCTGRADEGRTALVRALGTVSEGMLANTADTGEAEYNTIDGTLWFLHALGRHVETTGDVDLAAEAADTVEAVLRAHLDGTRFGIGADPVTGLLHGGADGWALTWMDARVDGRPITPRAGMPVEVESLWINALEAAVCVLEPVGRPTEAWRTLRATAIDSFGRRFTTAGGGLADVIDPDGVQDDRIRPNQLLAASLPHGPVQDATWARGVVSTCVDPLLTSVGLRSLAPGDPDYRGRHRGGPADRDAAYHQGTVWPWLIGPLVGAAIRAGEDPSAALDGLVAHLGEWGLGSVSETLDGDAPHGATGCPFQAWSVAELLRARQLLDRPGPARRILNTAP